MVWFKLRKRIRSDKLTQRRRKKLLFRFGGVVIAITILIGFSSWVFHRPYLQINHIIVNGNSVISDKDVTEVTEEILGGKYFFLFPRANSLIYPRKEIEISVLTAFQQVESIDLIRINFQTLSLEIKEQKPHALWCVKEYEKTQDCYFINREGLIFSKAPNFTGNVFFRFYGDLEDTDFIGKYYLKVDNEFNQVNVLIDSIKKLAVEPVELHILEEIDMELYMEDGSKILFTREQRSSEVLDNLKVVLESETFQNEKTENVEYIDLRFGNKVYFKLK